jgi:hypothetical protein
MIAVDYSSLARQPNCFVYGVYYCVLAASIKKMSRELRKQPVPKKHFDQTEEPTRSRTATSPIKRPNKRRQAANDADDAVDAAVAIPSAANG